MNDKSVQAPDLGHIRHQISTILTVEQSLKKSLESDPESARTLTTSNIQKLSELLKYLDDHSTDKEVV